MNEILDEILANQDLEYRDFHARLVPNVNNLLGLRGPIAKKIAKKYVNTDTGEVFLNSLPHTYYEENLIHGYMLGFLKESINSRLEKFLPHIDNWAVCDSMVANLKKAFKDKDKMLPLLEKCLESKKEYYVRFALVSLLSYYIEPEYMPLVLKHIKEVTNQEYYVKMANAWLISVCLVKEYERTLPLIREMSLDKWTHNKAIQKACESYRISKEIKDYLRSLKIK